MMCSSKLLLLIFFFVLFEPITASVYIMNHGMIKKKCFTVSVTSYLCLCVLSCTFLSGIMVLQCFGHVYKLDSEQLKLVCQKHGDVASDHPAFPHCKSEVGQL